MSRLRDPKLASLIPYMEIQVIIIFQRVMMMHFSTGTGLERVRIAGPELELSLGRSAGFGVGLLCKNKKERGLAGGFVRGRFDA